MKQYLTRAGLFLIALMTGAAGYGQLTVDQIDNDSLALHYVREMNYEAKVAPQWKFFYLTSGDEWQSYYNFSQAAIDQYKTQTQAPKWLKTDLNADGKPDLIVSGYIAKRPGDWSTATFKLLVFMSQPGKRYAEVNLLPDNSDKYPAYFNDIRLDGKSYLLLHRWQIQNDLNNQQPFQSDTLYYSAYWDSFLNFHQRGMRPSDIQNISYKVMEDHDGSYHALNIDLMSTKKTNMEIITKNASEKTPDINKARLARQLWIHMDSLIRSSYLTGRLNGDTIIAHRDFNSQQLPTYLTVTYTDGHKETYQDYGNGSTYSLCNIYSCMEHIIQNVFDQLQRRQMMLNSMADDLFGD